MDNHSYNLISAISEIGEGLEVYDKYIQDASECQDCQQLYKTLKDEAQKQMDVMKKLLISHAKADTLK